MNSLSKQTPMIVPAIPDDFTQGTCVNLPGNTSAQQLKKVFGYRKKNTVHLYTISDCNSETGPVSFFVVDKSQPKSNIPPSDFINKSGFKSYELNTNATVTLS